MRSSIHLLAATALALSGVAAQAGGLSPEIIETPPLAEEEMAPAGTSVNPAFVVLGILAVLLIAVAVSDDDDDGGDVMQPVNMN